MIGDLLGRLSLRSVPPRIIAVTAFASYLAQIFAIVQGWPLWEIALATLVPWLPLLTSEVRFTYRHYGWLALFYLLVVTQTGHVLEHLAQMVQIHALGLPPKEARGVFGALDIEWVHFIWNSWVLVAVLVLLVRFRRNGWLWAAAVLAGWHEIEHVAIMSAYLTTGLTGSSGLLSRGGAVAGGTPLIRPDLHMLYNAVETAPLLVAFFVELRRARDVWLARALPRLSAEELAHASAKLRPLRFRAGETICAEGEISDAFYVVASGECIALRRDASGRETVLRVLTPGDHFGEIGLLSAAPRTATVRARTDTELLAMDWRTFRSMIERSDAAARDLQRTAAERLAGTSA